MGIEDLPKEIAGHFAVDASGCARVDFLGIPLIEEKASEIGGNLDTMLSDGRIQAVIQGVARANAGNG